MGEERVREGKTEGVKSAQFS